MTMKRTIKIPLLLGLLSTGFLFSGCVSYPAHNGYYSPPVRSSVIIGVYDYPRYLDAPCYVYHNRYYYGGHYRNGYYYYRGRRLHRGHYYYRGYRYHHPRYRRHLKHDRRVYKKERHREYQRYNYDRKGSHGGHEYRR